MCRGVHLSHAFGAHSCSPEAYLLRHSAYLVIFRKLFFLICTALSTAEASEAAQWFLTNHNIKDCDKGVKSNITGCDKGVDLNLKGVQP